MVATEHEILIESEKEIINDCFNLLGYHQLWFMENDSGAEKVLVKEKYILQCNLLQKKLLKL